MEELFGTEMAEAVESAEQLEQLKVFETVQEQAEQYFEKYNEALNNGDVDTASYYLRRISDTYEVDSDSGEQSDGSNGEISFGSRSGAEKELSRHSESLRRQAASERVRYNNLEQKLKTAMKSTSASSQREIEYLTKQLRNSGQEINKINRMKANLK